MALTFYWRCESPTLDGVNDFSAGATSLSASAGAPTCDASARLVGASGNGLLIDDAENYTCAAASILGAAKGAVGLWVRSTTTGDQIFFRLRGAGSNEGVSLEFVGSELRLRINPDDVTNESFLQTSGAGMAHNNTNTYFVAAAWDAAAGKRYVAVYDAAMVPLAEAASTAAFAAPLGAQDIYFGNYGSFRGYQDNIFAGSEYRDAFEIIANASRESFPLYMPVRPPADLTFFWRCESTTFDPTHDYSAGGTTPTAVSGATIGATNAAVGTNGLTYEADYATYTFPSASIVNVDEGSVGAWVTFAASPAWNEGFTVFNARDASEVTNHILLSVNGAGSGANNVELNIRNFTNGQQSVTLTGANLVAGTRYFIVCRWNKATLSGRVEVYSQDMELLGAAQSTSLLASRWPAAGDVDTFLAGGDSLMWVYVDNMMVAASYEAALEHLMYVQSYAHFDRPYPVSAYNLNYGNGYTQLGGGLASCTNTVQCGAGPNRTIIITHFRRIDRSPVVNSVTLGGVPMVLLGDDIQLNVNYYLRSFALVNPTVEGLQDCVINTTTNGSTSVGGTFVTVLHGTDPEAAEAGVMTHQVNGNVLTPWTDPFNVNVASVKGRLLQLHSWFMSGDASFGMAETGYTETEWSGAGGIFRSIGIAKGNPVVPISYQPTTLSNDAGWVVSGFSAAIPTPATVTRYVNPHSAGGDGTTQLLTGGSAAYASLSAWDAARARDLIAANEIEQVICETDGNADTTRYASGAWVTAVNRPLIIRAGDSDRAGPRYDATKYRIEGAFAFFPCFNLNARFAQVTGLQVSNTAVGTGSRGFNLNGLGSPGLSDVFVDSCVAAYCDGHADADGFNITGGTYRLTNCVSIGNGGNGFRSNYGVYGVTTEFLNCVGVANGASGFDGGSTSNLTTLRNCYAGGNAVAGYSGGWDTIETCYSSDGALSTAVAAYSTSAGARFVNVTAGAEDLDIGALSTLRGAGTDLSATFSTDMVGTTRVAWDVGAIEYFSALSSVANDADLRWDALATISDSVSLSWDIAAAGETLRRWPQAILASVNLDGVVVNIQDDPAAPDGLWLTMSQT